MNTIEEVLTTVSKDNIYYVKKNSDNSLEAVLYSARFNPKNPINVKKAIAFMRGIQLDPSIIGTITNGEFTDSMDILAKMQRVRENNDFKERIKHRFERKMTKREMRVYRK